MEESKPIDHHHENWDAPVEDDDAERKVSTHKEEAIKEDSKPVIAEVKENYQKDKYGNILITSLGEYKEPPKQVKGARAADMNRHDNYSLFKEVFTHESDDEEEVKESVVLEEIMNINTKPQNKNKKGKKEEKLDELDDLLKELGVEHKPKEEVKKVKKEKENKPKEEKEDNSKKETTQGNPENEEKAKKKPAAEKKPQVKSHLNDAKREIKEKQEALKKKDKKRGI